MQWQSPEIPVAHQKEERLALRKLFQRVDAGNIPDKIRRFITVRNDRLILRFFHKIDLDHITVIFLLQTF